MIVSACADAEPLLTSSPPSPLITIWSLSSSAEIFVVAACYYLVLTSLWSVVQRRLEAHFGRSLDATAGVRSRRAADRVLQEQDLR